ncbi:hypothetical protein ACA910_001360 [Epithemia clementina (nom. ined.)]
MSSFLRKTNHKDSSYSFDKASYERALQSNRTLQLGIRERLPSIARRKAQNRQTKAALVGQFMVSQELPIITSTPAAAAKHVARWDRCFFRGSDGAIPDANHDSKDRRQAETTTFLRCNNHPWSSSELKLLRAVLNESRIIQQHENNQNDTIKRKRRSSNSNKEVYTINYGLVAQTLSAKKQGLLVRSADECRLAHMGLCESPFGKKERNDLFEVFSSLFKKPSDPSKPNDNNNYNGRSNRSTKTDWKAVAAALNTNRSPWECFREYQLYQHDNDPNKDQSSKQQQPKKQSKSQPWTRLQDELLFKYVAAMGPQLVIDGHEIAHLRSGSFFRDKTKPQLFHRINQSLLNPNLKHDAWNEEEERRLALCMKVYSSSASSDDNDTDDNQQLQKTDQKPSSSTLSTYFAATHIVGRSGTSVSDKWNRSLNPEYSARPFTKEEDKALLKVMRQHVEYGWVDIARQFFPDRHPHRLMNRWSEIATDEDIVRRCGGQDTLGVVTVQQQHVSTTGASPTTTATPPEAAKNQPPQTAAYDTGAQVRKRKR